MSRKKEYCIIDGKEYEVSPSMTAWGGGRWLIPVCEVCKHYNIVDETCSKLNPIPEEYLKCDKYDCPELEINLEDPTYTLIKKELGL